MCWIQLWCGNRRPETLSKLDSNLWSWLHRAAHQGRVEIVEYLLGENLKYAESLSSMGGANLTASQSLTSLSEHSQRLLPVNQQDVFGRSALHVAASYGTLACIEAMMSYNATISKLLHTALPRASPELKLLLSMDLDLRNTKGQTAALCAVRKGDTAILSALLSSGADCNVQDDHKLSCLQMVCSKLDPSPNSNTQESHAPTSSNRSPSSSSSNISSATSQTQTPHHHHHHHQQHQSLNKNGLIVDSPEFTSWLAEQARLLIQNGADLSLEDLHQENVLHYACRRVDTELLQTLLHNGKLHQTKSGLLSALRALFAKDGKLPASIASRLECVDLLNAAYLALIHKEVEMKGIAKMTTAEVCEWLVAIGLQVHRDLFLQHCVTGVFLQQVSEETIKSDLGMESLGQRIAFVSRLEELKDIDKRRTALSVASSMSRPSMGMNSSDSTLVGDENEDEDAILLGLPNAKDYEIKYEDLVIGDVIGRGNFGEVRRGQWSAVQVAVKTIYRTGGEAAKKDVYREMGILAQLRHPNILGFLGYVKSSGSVMMVTDLMTGGSLHNLIQSSFETVSRLRFGLVSGIVRGMVYLHHRRLVHRDLNTKNLLLDDHYTIKISDFGLSRPKYDHKMTMSVGFLGGMAPEVYRGNDYTEKADVFSFAMVVYEIITGKESHHAQSNVMMYAHNVSQHAYRPPLNDEDTPPIWNNFIRKCWAQDPAERPSFSQLLDELNIMEQTGARAFPSIPVTLTESGAYIT